MLIVRGLVSLPLLFPFSFPPLFILFVFFPVFSLPLLFLPLKVGPP